MQTIDFGQIQNLSLETGFSYCEKIAKQKNPFLYYVSRFFRDKNKFRAFCSSYASMRILDDLIDGIKNRSGLSFEERQFYLNEIDRWETIVADCHNGKELQSPLLLALSNTFQNFNIPLAPWTKLARAMRSDIERSRFRTFEEFLEYSEGAAIAPATVFMHVLLAAPSGKQYECRVKDVDPYFYARDLAIFCYLTHILRDISCDLELVDRGLVYLPIEDLNGFTVSENDLWEFKRGKAINHNFQDLMICQIERARNYGRRGEMLMKELYHKLDADCRFILNLLVSLYIRTMDKIERVGYNVFSGEHEIGIFEIFETTFHNARVHSYGKLRTVRFGLSLLRRSVMKRIRSSN
jgi:phytoene synthase